MFSSFYIRGWGWVVILIITITACLYCTPGTETKNEQNKAENVPEIAYIQFWQLSCAKPVLSSSNQQGLGRLCTLCLSLIHILVIQSFNPCAKLLMNYQLMFFSRSILSTTYYLCTFNAVWHTEFHWLYLATPIPEPMINQLPVEQEPCWLCNLLQSLIQGLNMLTLG